MIFITEVYINSTFKIAPLMNEVTHHGILMAKGKQMQLEIERKFLVKPGHQENLVHGTLVRQGYLETTGSSTVRVRIKGDKGFLTIKGPSDLGGLVRSEFEYEIPLTDAHTMIDTLCGVRVLEKTRYFVPLGRHTWEVDVFHGLNSGLVMAEVEMSSVDDAVELPEWLDAEVTGDPRYYNSSLVQNPWTAWG
jgi:CYTH domain-containing protein